MCQEESLQQVFFQVWPIKWLCIKVLIHYRTKWWDGMEGAVPEEPQEEPGILHISGLSSAAHSGGQVVSFYVFFWAGFARKYSRLCGPFRFFYDECCSPPRRIIPLL